MLISQWEVCQEEGIKKGLLGGHGRLLTTDMDDRVTSDIMKDIFHPVTCGNV